MHAINDICRSFVPPTLSIGQYNDQYSHFYGPSINGANPKTFEKVLFEMVNERWYSVFDQTKEKSYDLSFYKSRKAYNSYMSRLAEIVTKDSVKIVFVEQPSLYKEDNTENELKAMIFGEFACHNGDHHASPESLRLAMEAYNADIEVFCENSRIDYVKTDSKVDKTLIYFSDDVHYTPKGAEKMAEIVSTYLINNTLDTIRR